jgi:hypothetical protein
MNWKVGKFGDMALLPPKAFDISIGVVKGPRGQFKIPHFVVFGQLSEDNRYEHLGLLEIYHICVYQLIGHTGIDRGDVQYHMGTYYTNSSLRPPASPHLGLQPAYFTVS